ncbi:MAG: DUF6079 family protein [Bacteroidaceae bacterium]|nr:DUF6079 family protein [Bacteroidaceae bacterium]
MKYKDLIQFDPIEEVIKFNQLQSEDYRHSLVRNFVFSNTYEKTIIPEICRDLDYTSSTETFGLQIVGDFGTGKSHLMSLFSLIAEDENLLQFIKNDSAKQNLGIIAGKYKIIRFEMGSTDELWNIVCEQIDLAFDAWGINYSIAADSKGMYKDRLNRMMAQFEEVFPSKGLMIVIDEMLEYLKGRASDDRLNRDLSVLRALGEFSDRTKFRMVFGVQEQIYNVPQFQYAAKMLQHANDRYRQIPITKQDVQFVVQERLLHKSDDQKATIRKHLSKFTEFFTDMHAKLDEYVNLFPVNPSFFENFQQIKIGKSQREVMKTLTKKFQLLLDESVPETYPGLICYDHYWDDLNVPAMMTEPDVRRVSEIMDTVHQKIDENFTGVRQKKAPLAHRIANACAVKILQDSLEKTNGVSVENLIDDLCYLDAGCMDRDFLMDTISTIAKQIVTATVGQYFEKNDTNQEFHLRIEGGVNYEQKIKDYIPTMSEDKKDQHFFNFLCEFLPIEVEQYKREFKIYRHRIDWRSHKTMLDGYIFFGNPNERSTAQPELQFYIYFMPLFNKAKMAHGDEADSIYIHVENYSQEFKELLELYAAAEEQIASVDSSQKPFYQQFKKRYEEKLKPVFQRDFMQCTDIYYQGEKQVITPQMMTGGSKEQIVSNIASTLLEDYFCQQLPNYPKFTLLRTPLTKDNRTGIIKAARQKIANPTQPNRDGEAILAGLGLLQENELSTDTSIYAVSVRNLLENKGEGQVLNRDEIVHQFFSEKGWETLWYSNDYQLEADFEFLVLMTMVARGEIEIELPGKSINAVNLKDTVDLPQESFYSFTHVARPKGMNPALVREVFLGVLGKDLTSQAQNPEIYPQLVSEAKAIAATSVKVSSEIVNGIYLDNVEILDELTAVNVRNMLKTLANCCDRIQNFASPTKMRSLPKEWTVDGIHRIFEAKQHIASVKKMQMFANDFRTRTSYLSQAKRYMTDEQMKTDVDNALAKIPEIVKVMNDEQKVSTYKAELDAIINRYADWYLTEYNRLHINGLEDADKRKIMNMNEKKSCDAVVGADHDKGYITVAPQYIAWTKKMASLTVASPSVTKEAILRSPYQAFDPVQFVGKQLPKLEDLKTELMSIHNSIDESLHHILSDESLLANKDILESGELGLLTRFNNKSEELSPMNAERLMEILSKLQKGINWINTSLEALRTVFNRPMTPDDAVKAFRQHIRNITGGNTDPNIRIILK